MIDSSDLAYFMMLNTIGLSSLCQTLRTAARAKFTNAESSKTEAQQCYLFIQGTGLNQMIEEYHLGYNAESLRMSFNYYYKNKNK